MEDVEKVVQAATAALESRNLKPKQFRAIVTQLSEEECCVTFVDKAIPADKSARGNPSRRLPAVEVYVNLRTLKVRRSRYAR